MMRIIVKALYMEHQDVIVNAVYDDEEECARDLAIFCKPSIFGSRNFKIEIKEA